MAIKDSIKGNIVWSKFIGRKERVEDYVEGVEWLEKNGFEIACVAGIERDCPGIRFSTANFIR